MGKKKIKGTLEYTVEDCRLVIEELETRCDYTKIGEAFKEINKNIKEALERGNFKTKIGRIFSYTGTVLPVLIFASDWENDDSLHLSAPEWRIIIKELKDAGFTVEASAETTYITVTWKVE